VTGAIVGVRHPDQVEGLAAAGDFHLSKGEIDEIEKFLSE
jgi:aryl-alcohol dehydrogenase-like predicted oxidoreductase